MIKKLLRPLVVGLFYLTTAITFSQTVFINELHYDNASTDADEAIEIAGPAGTDLTGWSLVLYNGSNGTVYATINLTGVLPDQQAGFGTAIELIPGIQNGAPDGVALVNGTTVIQFLSYEGSFTAVGGPADGQISTDIGIAESSGTPLGASLVLTGEGTEYTDFNWTVATSNSYGAINTDQSFGTPVLLPLINEFVFNHTSSDTDEFVEVFTVANTDLSAFTLLEIEGDANAPGTIDEVIPLTSTDANGYFTTGFSNNAFENGTVSLLLVNNFTGNLGDDLDTNDDGILDTLPWDVISDAIAVTDGDTGDFTYGSTTLEPGFDGITFTVGGASRIPNGTDTDAVTNWARNDFDGQGLPSFPDAVATNGEALNTPGEENEVVIVIEPINLIINELDADTSGTDALEFIELYDGGAGNAALDGYVLVLYNGSGDSSYNAFDLDGFTTDANGYFVLGNTDVPGAAIIFSGNGLQNGADAVALYEGNAADFPNGTALSLTNLVDAIVYDTNDADDATLLTLLNTREAQLNEDELGNKDEHSLQRFVNGSGGPRTTANYVNAIPTPGRSNTNATEPISIVINELDVDTPSSDTEEFVELYDGGAGNTALDGFTLVLYNGNGDVSYNAFDLDGFTTDANGYFVIGNATVTNIDFTVPDGTFQNGADAVALYQADAVAFPNGTVITTDGLIDALVYGTGDPDDVELLALLNPGQLQVDENENGSQTSESMQRIPNGDGGALNTTTYTAATPTPGVANDLVIMPGEIISIADARTAAAGSVVTITGILTASDNFAGPAFIQDTTGGIAIFDDTVHGDDVFAIGDSLTVTGTRTAFNALEQISPVAVVNDNSPATTVVTPRTITLGELANYPGELVRIENVSFPNPGDLLFGNSNFTLTDASGTGEMRIDNDVLDLVGLAQPESCSEIIGVVGRFNDTFQLLPRIASDLSCAEPFVPPGDTIGIPKEETFDIVTWNIEWFGDENNSPAAGNPLSDPIQRDSVQTILEQLDADVYTVQEIADDALFDELVNLLPGYDYVLSTAFSNPSGTPPFQKLGFIYKTETVSPVSTQVLLQTIHPLYNGGDDSALVDYPSETTRFYASGRLPFLMTADITINGATEQLDLIALHARANSSSDSQNRYDMRTYDVGVLKDSLDVQFADRKVILLGDYNDDVDETVADIPSTISSFQVYVDDPLNYNIVSSALSDQGLRSFVSRENMIDHIGISDELFESYIDSSVTVHYEVYDNDYSRTASDHFPVSARFQLTPLTLTEVEITNVSCNGENDGTATVMINGGAPPYAYAWSDGQTTATATDLSPGSYSVVVTDFLGRMVISEDIRIEEPQEIDFSITQESAVYIGYDPAACTTLSVTDISASPDTFEFNWSTGETTENITICPEATTTYSVTVTDENGCTSTKEITVEVIDISCGNNPYRPKVTICHRGKTLCVPQWAVQWHLDHGDTLGECGPDNVLIITKVIVAPNPVRNNTKVYLKSNEAVTASFVLYDFYGRERLSTVHEIPSGSSTVQINFRSLPRGIYFLKTKVGGVLQQTNIILKR
ncbi:MAG: DUF5689 domain-containing protein [Saonia sp.]